MNLIELIQIDHLDGQQRELAECIGIEAYRKLLASYGGDEPYIARPMKLVQKNKSSIIRNNFTGNNQRELCNAFGISVREFDKIIQGYK